MNVEKILEDMKYFVKFEKKWKYWNIELFKSRTKFLDTREFAHSFNDKYKVLLDFVFNLKIELEFKVELCNKSILW